MVQYALLKEKGDQRIIKIFNKSEEQTLRDQVFYLNQETDWICRVIPITKRGTQDTQEKEYDDIIADLYRKSIVRPRNPNLDKTMETLTELLGS